MSGFRLIVGLGNPGPEYAETRHNAGSWLVEAWAQALGLRWVTEQRFHGLLARFQGPEQDVRFLLPQTYMNKSGLSVLSVASFFKILPTEILVAHDELDLPPGCVRLKQGGGHGGHNGLRDIISSLSHQQGFARLRLGIGHPGEARQVVDYVLGRPPMQERRLIEAAIEAVLDRQALLLQGDLSAVMNQLNGFKPLPL